MCSECDRISALIILRDHLSDEDDSVCHENDRSWLVFPLLRVFALPVRWLRAGGLLRMWLRRRRKIRYEGFAQFFLVVIYRDLDR